MRFPFLPIDYIPKAKRLPMDARSKILVHKSAEHTIYAFGGEFNSEREAIAEREKFRMFFISCTGLLFWGPNMSGYSNNVMTGSSHLGVMERTPSSLFMLDGTDNLRVIDHLKDNLDILNWNEKLGNEIALKNIAFLKEWGSILRYYKLVDRVLTPVRFDQVRLG